MILGITISYIMGILGGLYKELFVIVPFIFLLFLNKNIRKYIKHTIKSILIYACIFIVGVIYINVLENSFENKYKDVQEVKIIGTIISNPKYKDYKVEYVIKVDSNNYKNTKLLLNIKKDENINFKYGDQIYIKSAEFEQAESARNYKGYSYKDYLKNKKIYGIITATKNDIKIIKQNNINIISKVANDTSNSIREKIDLLLPEEQAGLLKGILIGDKNELPQDISTNFKNSNLSHMLAVSGAHVSYIILGITFFLNNIRINKRLSKIITILLLLFFIVLVGGTSSVTRACIMAIYIILGGILHKKTNIIASISVSLLIILVINPYSIFDLGLLLSYGGTVGIIAFVKKFRIKKCNKIISNVIQMMIVSISANIIILPIMIYNFNKISFTFIISNTLASPIFGIIVILGFVCVIISYIFMPISNLLSSILNILLKILIQIAEICSKIPLSNVYVKTPSILLVIVYYIFICIFLRVTSNTKKYRFEKRVIIKVKSIGYKKIISIAILILMVFISVNIFPRNLKIYFIDVGQGDSTLIVTPHRKTILIDGGGSKEENFNVGEQVLLPYLLDRGISKLDYCIISHFDSDHVGGILYILDHIKVKNVIIGKQFESSENYKKFISIVNRKNIKVSVVESKTRISIEKDLFFDVIWPDSKQMVSENSINNNALVLKLNYKRFNMLFTGDIEEAAEKILVSKYANTNTNVLKATVLKVGHHGSKTSSTQEFIQLVNPKVALIGVGKNNTFGHPNEDVIKRFKDMRYKSLQDR